jgi:adenosylcobinamide-GDP ribazoletransferase
VNFMRHYIAAVHSFTRVPVTGALAQWIGASGPEDVRASAAHFPGVGWLVGIVACAAFALVGLLLPGSPFAPLAAAVGCTVATLILTGGAHEIGLARVADALGGPSKAARALEIMADSRIGAFGVLALVLALLAKVSLLAVLAAQSPVAVLVALLAGHVVSRFWPLLLGRGLPGMPGLTYLGDVVPTGKPLAEPITSQALGIAGAWSAVALALAWAAQGAGFAILPVIAGGLALLWMQRMLARRLQGFTHESLGATQQLGEIAFYFGAAIGVQVT